MQPRATRAERFALVGGILLAAISLTVVALLPTAIQQGLGIQWVAHTALGKETGIPAGLAAGVPAPMAMLAAFAQDVVVLLIGYPLVASVGRGTLRWKWIRRFVLERPHPRHHAFASRTETAGVTLLALTLWLPFLPSGALVASIAARALGYRAGLFLPILTLSALLSSLAYTLVFALAFQHIPDTRIVWGLAIGVALVSAVTGFFVHRREKRRAIAEMDAASDAS